jgi:hypothetical protein
MSGSLLLGIFSDTAPIKDLTGVGYHVALTSRLQICIGRVVVFHLDQECDFKGVEERYRSRPARGA